MFVYAGGTARYDIGGSRLGVHRFTTSGTGGGDPVAWCEKLRGRLPFIHLKDYGFTAANQPVFAEIGAGNLDWPRLIAAAERAGCEWFIVEQDVCPGDPFDSLRRSFEYLKTLVSPTGV